MPRRRSFLQSTTLGLLGLPLAARPGRTEASVRPEGPQSLERLRGELLVPEGTVYLNTASLGPSPRWLVEEQLNLIRELESDPVGRNWGDLGARMEAVRAIVARFIGATKDEIVLTRNTTEGLNLVAESLRLDPGDEILTTNHEHGGGENGLKYLVERDGAVLRKLEMPMPASSVEQVVDRVERHVTAKTKVLLLSHVTTVTGLRMPMKAISEITRRRGIVFIADGAQAPGLVEVDVADLGVDAYASSGHKWLLGPKETGFLYLRREFQERFNSAFTFKGFDAYTQSCGTRNVALLVALGEILEWHASVGQPAVEEKCLSLREYCRGRLAAMGGLEVMSPSEPALSTGIVSADLKRGKNDEIVEALRERDIIIKLLPNYNAVRFSCHVFNTREDIDRTLDGLERLLA